MTTIVVTGGTGTLGGIVCERLRERGHEVRALSRHSEPYTVDLLDGTGLDAALTGADVVVHCASAPRGDEQAARHLVAGMQRAGVRHVVYISIVGVDEVPIGYYRSKLAVERLVMESGLGWTVLRATQFHGLIVTMLRTMAKPPVMLVPKGVSDQPVEVSEVADRLAELATSEPAGRVADMGGPQILTFPQLARAYLRASGLRRRVVPVRLAGRTYHALRDGGQLAPRNAVGKGTFEQYLTERFGAPG